MSFQHHWAKFFFNEQKTKWLPEQSEQDLNTHNFLNIMVETQSLCLYQCFEGQGS